VAKLYPEFFTSLLGYIRKGQERIQRAAVLSALELVRAEAVTVDAPKGVDYNRCQFPPNESPSFFPVVTFNRVLDAVLTHPDPSTELVAAFASVVRAHSDLLYYAAHTIQARMKKSNVTPVAGFEILAALTVLPIPGLDENGPYMYIPGLPTQMAHIVTETKPSEPVSKRKAKAKARAARGAQSTKGEGGLAAYEALVDRMMEKEAKATREAKQAAKRRVRNQAGGEWLGDEDSDDQMDAEAVARAERSALSQMSVELRPHPCHVSYGLFSKGVTNTLGGCWLAFVKRMHPLPNHLFLAFLKVLPTHVLPLIGDPSPLVDVLTVGARSGGVSAQLSVSALVTVTLQTGFDLPDLYSVAQALLVPETFTFAERGPFMRSVSVLLATPRLPAEMLRPILLQMGSLAVHSPPDVALWATAVIARVLRDRPDVRDLIHADADAEGASDPKASAAASLHAVSLLARHPLDHVSAPSQLLREGAWPDADPSDLADLRPVDVLEATITGPRKGKLSVGPKRVDMLTGGADAGRIAMGAKRPRQDEETVTPCVADVLTLLEARGQEQRRAALAERERQRAAEEAAAADPSSSSMPSLRVRQEDLGCIENAYVRKITEGNTSDVVVQAVRVSASEYAMQYTDDVLFGGWS
ncbi:nucleolar complex protein 4, partial [Kipferlia bialata]